MADLFRGTICGAYRDEQGQLRIDLKSSQVFTNRQDYEKACGMNIKYDDVDIKMARDFLWKVIVEEWRGLSSEGYTGVMWAYNYLNEKIADDGKEKE